MSTKIVHLSDFRTKKEKEGKISEKTFGLTTEEPDAAKLLTELVNQTENISMGGRKDVKLGSVVVMFLLMQKLQKIVEENPGCCSNEAMEKYMEHLKKYTCRDLFGFLQYCSDEYAHEKTCFYIAVVKTLFSRGFLDSIR